MGEPWCAVLLGACAAGSSETGAATGTPSSEGASEARTIRIRRAHPERERERTCLPVRSLWLRSSRSPLRGASRNRLGRAGLTPDEPGVDTFNDHAGHTLSIVGEKAVALAEWTCSIGQHLQGEHALVVEDVEDTLVASSPARISDYHMTISPYVIHYLTVEVVRDGQGLTLAMESTTGRDDEDRRLYEQKRSSPVSRWTR